jgi:hypothetical protein
VTPGLRLASLSVQDGAGRTDVWTEYVVMLFGYLHSTCIMMAFLGSCIVWARVWIRSHIGAERSTYLL